MESSTSPSPSPWTKSLRWALVPIAGLSVWYAVLFAGIAGVGVLDSFCPPELELSGACSAPWHAPAVDALVIVCTAIVAAGIVIVPALAAASHRFGVAAVAYACGAAVATYAASDGSLWGPFFTAAASGSGALWLAFRWWWGGALAAPPDADKV